MVLSRPVYTWQDVMVCLSTDIVNHMPQGLWAKTASDVSFSGGHVLGDNCIPGVHRRPPGARKRAAAARAARGVSRAANNNGSRAPSRNARHHADDSSEETENLQDDEQEDSDDSAKSYYTPDTASPVQKRPRAREYADAEAGAISAPHAPRARRRVRAPTRLRDFAIR